MRYQQTMTYDAPAAAVYKMLTDPAFQQQRSQWGRPVASDSSVTPGPGDGATIGVTRTLSIDPPAFLKALIGNQITIIESQVWGDAAGASQRQGTLVVEIKGQPGGVNGTVKLTEAGGRTTADVDAEVKVRVPLIGGKVESYVAGMLDKLLTKDAELGQTWLAER
jgi:carbon monoxide dehydrogenase subunit G